MRARAVVTATVLLVAVACSDDGGSGEAADEEPTADTAATTTSAVVEDPYEGYQSELYGGDENWLCRPDLDDVCDESLDTTVVHADGTIEVEPHEVAEDPPVDCFYVYPTVSFDDGAVADLNPGVEEANAVRNQAARFSSLCRVYAPVYRQITLNGIGGLEVTEEDRAVAYGDVVDAWKAFITLHSEGRPFVFIGHSQGSGHLNRLIAEEIDGQPLQDRLVSALLLGSAVEVPDGEAVGGAFSSIPVCTEEGQAGCIITYASYRSTEPPGAIGFFGDVEGPARAACTNPAALGGGSAPLTPYFDAGAGPSFSPSATDPPEIETRWVTYPDLITGECVQDGEYDYLEITVEADPADPRVDDIPGDLTPGWGLHLVDANVAMGDLLDRVAEQIDAHLAG